MRHVEMQQVIEAPAQAMWERYTDHVSWTDWAGVGTVRLDHPGIPPLQLLATRIFRSALRGLARTRF